MSVSPFDSALRGGLFADTGVTRLFSDGLEVRAMMLVLGALARAQGASGVIPEASGAFLHRAMREVQIDPAGLAGATGRNGVTVPGLVAALRPKLQRLTVRAGHPQLLLRLGFPVEEVPSAPRRALDEMLE